MLTPLYVAPPSLAQPKRLPDEYWEAISAEEVRLHRAITEQDKPDVLGSLKSLAESISKVALDLAGEPSGKNDDFGKVLNRAHNILCAVPALDLTSDSRFSSMASQAKKMAGSLDVIRNGLGTGHGRARVPEVQDEMVALSIEGTMVWARWAIRRLGALSAGRPGVLIRELDDGSVFYAGDLAERLHSADIPNLEQQHQRALGFAVGQRTMRGTFNVGHEGVEPCIMSDSLNPWTPDYRRGLAAGLLYDRDGNLDRRPSILVNAIHVLDPNPDNSELLEQVATDVETSFPPIHRDASEEWLVAAPLLRRQAASRPESERTVWNRLVAEMLDS